MPPYPIAAPASANFLCLNAFLYFVLSYVTSPTTISAITEIPANTPKPMGRTESFFPGIVKFAAVEAELSAALLVEEAEEAFAAAAEGVVVADAEEVEEEAAEVEVAVGVETVAVMEEGVTEEAPFATTAAAAPPVEVVVADVDVDVELDESVEVDEEESVDVEVELDESVEVDDDESLDDDDDELLLLLSDPELELEPDPLLLLLSLLLSLDLSLVSTETLQVLTSSTRLPFGFSLITHVSVTAPCGLTPSSILVPRNKSRSRLTYVSYVVS